MEQEGGARLETEKSFKVRFHKRPHSAQKVSQEHLHSGRRSVEQKGRHEAGDSPTNFRRLRSAELWKHLAKKFLQNLEDCEGTDKFGENCFQL